MTSLVCWLGVDQRAPASLYLVSDSRFTLLDGAPVGSGQKAYASGTSPDVFAFCGDVQIPSQILRQIEEKGLPDLDPSTDRHQRLVERLTRAFGTYAQANRRSFTVLHGARDGIGLASTFRLWTTSWNPENGWNDKSEGLPTQSVLALAAGSGADPVRRQEREWRRSDVGRTSRAVFSAFCDALLAGDDPLSGGPPQIVSLYRQGRAEAIGVIFDGQRYLRGAKLAATDPLIATVEWRNVLFERCDPTTMNPLPGAQRHARPRQLAG